jgi:hypothetical protein
MPNLDAMAHLRATESLSRQMLENVSQRHLETVLPSEVRISRHGWVRPRAVHVLGTAACGTFRCVRLRVSSLCGCTLCCATGLA